MKKGNEGSRDRIGAQITRQQLHALGLPDQVGDHQMWNVDFLDDAGINARTPQRLRPTVDTNAPPGSASRINHPSCVGADECTKPSDRVLRLLNHGVEDGFAPVSVVGERFDFASELLTSRQIIRAKPVYLIGPDRRYEAD